MNETKDENKKQKENRNKTTTATTTNVVTFDTQLSRKQCST